MCFDEYPKCFKQAHGCTCRIGTGRGNRFSGMLDRVNIKQIYVE